MRITKELIEEIERQFGEDIYSTYNERDGRIRISPRQALFKTGFSSPTEWRIIGEVILGADGGRGVLAVREGTNKARIFSRDFIGLEDAVLEAWRR